ncbi:MAG: extracellular solute-binding protein [Alphaproteobacteria bacterium]
MLKTACLVISLTLCAAVTNAAERTHGLSAFGELKYPADFQQFDYVVLNAPRAGTLRTQSTTAQNSFDSLNGYILKGVPAAKLDLLLDSLMVRAMDEPDAVYGLVAAWANVADDKKSVTFGLRPEAKFADGSPLRARDVAKSFDLLKTKGDPAWRFPLRDVRRAIIIDPLTLKFEFEGEELRDLPLTVSQLPIFSADYYAMQPFDQTTTEAPLGSGPYRVADKKLGQFVAYERRDDYWARDLPVNRGRWNFKNIRFDYFRDRSIAFEAFKAGALDLREEFTSKTWATEYNFPAITQGRVKKELLTDERPSGTQAFFLNTRRDKFKDIRVRQAMDLAFDYEWTNKTLFHKAYLRTQSIFENSEMAARQGPPEGPVLALLKPYRDQLPKSVFTSRYQAPKTDGSGKDRRNLRKAANLLKEAGWEIKDGHRVNAKGEALTAEFLMFEPSFERIIAPYIARLKKLGIASKMRVVDMAQYQARVESYDFDLVSSRFTFPNTPGNELRGYMGSQAAKQPGSFNLAGISDPVVDVLIEKVIKAQNRADMLDAARALDRVVMAGNYLVPHWYKASHSIAYYDKFGRPPHKPKYARGILDLWWVDPAKETALQQKGNQ